MRACAVPLRGGRVGARVAAGRRRPSLPRARGAGRRGGAFAGGGPARAACGVSEDGTGECLTTRDLPDLEEVPEGPLTQICSGTYGVCGLTDAGDVVCTGLAADYERLTL